MHEITLTSTAHATTSLSWSHIHEYLDSHRWLLALVVVVTIGSPFLGLVLASWAGVAVSLVIGVATFFVSLRAITRVREITTGHAP
jgi:hypothetical protein